MRDLLLLNTGLQFNSFVRAVSAAHTRTYHTPILLRSCGASAGGTLLPLRVPRSFAFFLRKGGDFDLSVALNEPQRASAAGSVLGEGWTLQVSQKPRPFATTLLQRARKNGAPVTAELSATSWGCPSGPGRRGSL